MGASLGGLDDIIVFCYQRITVHRVSYGPPREVITVNLEIFARILFSRIALKTNLRRSKFATKA